MDTLGMPRPSQQYGCRSTVGSSLRPCRYIRFVFVRLFIEIKKSVGTLIVERLRPLGAASAQYGRLVQINGSPDASLRDPHSPSFPWLTFVKNSAAHLFPWFHLRSPVKRQSQGKSNLLKVSKGQFSFYDFNCHRNLPLRAGAHSLVFGD